ncbi:helix-turn-helix domain-containing protein [Geovibrio thiophilus]
MKHFVRKKGLTQKALADLVGVKQSSVSNIESSSS